MGFLAPAYIKKIQKISTDIGLTYDEVESQFIEGAKKIKTTIHSPVSAGTAWEKISSEVYGDDDLDGGGNPSGQYWKQ